MCGYCQKELDVDERIQRQLRLAPKTPLFCSQIPEAFKGKNLSIYLNPFKVMKTKSSNGDVIFKKTTSVSDQ